MKHPREDAELPSSIDSERFVLGAVLSGQSEIIDALLEDDFSLESHKRIYRCLHDLRHEGKPADRATVYNELARLGQAESVGGLSYLVTLDAGMPALYNAEGWIEILREKSRLRAILRQLEDIKNRAYQGEKTHHLLGSIEQVGQTISSSVGTKKALKTIGDVVAEIGVNEFFTPRRMRGIDAPFAWLRKTGFSFGRKTLTTVAAATSVGKSAFLRSCCLHAALKGHRTALYSLEVPSDEVYRACIALLGSVNMQRFRAGQHTDDEVKDANASLERLIDNELLYVCDEGDITVPDIRQALTQAANAGSPYEFLAIDYVQQLTPIGKFSNRNEEVSSVSRGVKMISQTYGIAVVQAAQLSRAAEQQQRAPRLYDLRESGSLEQDSNNVILLHRKTSDNDADQWLVNANLAKQRNGALQEQDMWFTRRYARFDEIEESEPLGGHIGNGYTDRMELQ